MGRKTGREIRFCRDTGKRINQINQVCSRLILRVATQTSSRYLDYGRSLPPSAQQSFGLSSRFLQLYSRRGVLPSRVSKLEAFRAPASTQTERKWPDTVPPRSHVPAFGPDSSNTNGKTNIPRTNASIHCFGFKFSRVFDPLLPVAFFGAAC